MIRLAAAVVLTLLAAPAVAQCRQALALGLDVSGSVNSREYLLQTRGLANALRHPEVSAALLAVPSAPVRLAVFEWSGPGYQRMLVDWQAVTGTAQLAEIADRLDRVTRAPAPPGTALGTAMRYGAGLLAGQGDCWKRTLDISGDGTQNLGPHPRDVKAALAGSPITINGLVIGSDTGAQDRRQEHIGELTAYFRAFVITGPDAFVESALGFEAYEAAMVRKLKRELQGLAVAALRPLPAHDRPLSRYSGSGRSSSAPPVSARR